MKKLFIKIMFILGVVHSFSYAKEKTILTLYKNGGVIQQSIPSSMYLNQQQVKILLLAEKVYAESLMMSMDMLVSKAEISNDSIVFTPNYDVKKDASNTDEPFLITYSFGDISWKVTYTLQIDSDGKRGRLNGWLHIDSKSKLKFKDAKLSLVDGSLPLTSLISEENIKKKEQDQLSDSQTYSFENNFDMDHGKQKRILWFSSNWVPLEQDFRVFVGGKALQNIENQVLYPPVEAWLSFLNRSEYGLGQPMPSGEASLYFQKSDQQILKLPSYKQMSVDANEELSYKIPRLEMIQSASTNDTDEYEYAKIETKLEQNQFRYSNDTKTTESHYKLEIKNNDKKRHYIKVILDDAKKMETLKIVRSTHNYKVVDGKNCIWMIEVPPQQTVYLRYHIRYQS
ncbi:MAG: hypothetical protein C0432_02590 [Candidatus Puniceispirillum sp.]|nr:hypothetical protein [Candidatus Pelagibacter sp.]MBA4283163.1 hypothetical protein [Candidatus Puniceispirillum sp.]